MVVKTSVILTMMWINVLLKKTSDIKRKRFSKLDIKIID